ncbi:MAG: hypothetical protein V4808_07130 [Pseudomonadota bacterium]
MATMLAAATALAPAIVIRNQPAIMAPDTQVRADRRRKLRRQAVASGMLARVRRSRGAQAKPRRRSNRVTVSRRVRRKHRRAA